MNASTKLVRIGDGRVRASDAELHRAACKAIYEGNHIVFESLPSVIRQIIEYKTWKSYGKASFADYALDATSNGLGVNSNPRLWMLKCAMDVYEDHIKEWADILTKVEEMVMLIPVVERGTARSLRGNSLERLAKKSEAILTDKRITYLPSACGGNSKDTTIIRLRRKRPELFKRMITGELSVPEALAKAGYAANHLNRARYCVRTMTPKERREFIAWMKEEGYLE